MEDFDHIANDPDHLAGKGFRKTSIGEEQRQDKENENPHKQLAG
jgi:hypothetical protein